MQTEWLAALQLIGVPIVAVFLGLVSSSWRDARSRGEKVVDRTTVRLDKADELAVSQVLCNERSGNLAASLNRIEAKLNAIETYVHSKGDKPK